MIMTVFEGQRILFQAVGNQRQNMINPFNKKDILKAFKKKKLKQPQQDFCIFKPITINFLGW